MEDTTVNQIKSIRSERFTFSGGAGEYFGILFTNGLLNAITLGIYSPWAKVRALQYLYGNTDLAGGEFQFTADPKKMLVSRIIALLLFVTFFFVENLGTQEALFAYIAMMAAFFIFAPIVTVFVMSFRLRYSRWRGISFNFNKDYKGAYRVYLAPLSLIALALACLYLPFQSEVVEDTFGMTRHEAYLEPIEEYVPDDQTQIQGEETYEEKSAEELRQEISQENSEDGEIAEDMYDSYDAEEEDSYINPYFFIPSGVFLLVFLVLVPYFDFINMRFLARNVKFGRAAFTYRATVQEFYKIYAILFVGVIALAVVWGVSAYLESFWLALLASFIYFVFSKAFMKSKRYNLVIGKTTIDNDKFRLKADVPFWKMLYILVTNTLGVVLTFGMLRAWAYIRTVQMLLDHTSVETEESFDDFVAHQNEELSAIGEEVADAFDIDVAF